MYLTHGNIIFDILESHAFKCFSKIQHMLGLLSSLLYIYTIYRQECSKSEKVTADLYKIIKNLPSKYHQPRVCAQYSLSWDDIFCEDIFSVCFPNRVTSVPAEVISRLSTTLAANPIPRPSFDYHKRGKKHCHRHIGPRLFSHRHHTTPPNWSYCLEHHIYAEKIMRPQFLDQKLTPKKHKLR